MKTSHKLRVIDQARNTCETFAGRRLPSQGAWIAALGLVIWLGMAAAGVTQQAASPKQDPRVVERDSLWREAQAARDAGKWAEAIRLGRAVVDLEAKLLGPEHQELLSTWDLVGECAERAEDWGAALAARDAALRIAEAAYPAGDYHVTGARFVRDHLNLLRNMTAAQRKRLRKLEQDIGRVEQFLHQGRYSDGVKLAQEAIADSQQLLGPEHPFTATSLNDLAVLYEAQGNSAASEPLEKRALEIREKVFGPEHPATAISLNNLALLYQSQGSYKAAEPLYRRALEIMEKAFGPAHPLTASSLNNIAELYREQAKYAMAEPLYRRALEVNEEALGEEHPDTATTLNNLAILYRSQGKYAAAEPLFQRALLITEKALGPEHPDTAIRLNNLAELYRYRGNLAAAEPLYQRALKIQEKVLSPEHPTTASTLNNLALLYEAQANYAAAEPLFQRALKIREKVLGAEHPNITYSLGGLAALYEAQGKYARSEPLKKRALAIREKVLGPEHPDTANSLNNLADLYRVQGKYAASELLYRRALNIKEKALGPEHPDTAIGLNNLAELYRLEGSYTAADPLYRRALAICEQSLGPEHPDTARSLSNLALLSHAQGSYGTAERLFQRALKLMGKVLGPEHPETTTIINNLATLYQSQGKYTSAEPLFQRALAINERARGPEHPDTANSLNNFAAFYRVKGNYAAAEPLYRRALEIREKALGPEHPFTATSLNNLADLYCAQANFEAAEPLYRRALLINEKTLGPEHPDTALNLNNLALMYVSQGNDTASKLLFQQALQIRERVLGPEHPDTAQSLNNLAGLYQLQGNYTAAEPLCRRALAIYEKSLGPEHQDTARGLNNLAELYRAQGNYAGPKPLYQRALQICEKVLVSEHPVAATCRCNLALLYWQHLDPTKARPFAEETLAAMRKHLEQTAAFQSEQQQLLMAQQGGDILSAWLTIGSRTKAPADDWTRIIPWKGLVTARQTLLRRALKDEPVLAEYRQITQQLSRVAITPPPYPSDPKQLPAWEANREDWLAEKTRLEQTHELLEKELARKSSAFSQSQARQQVTVAQITTELARQPRPTAFIDLYSYWYAGQGDEKSEQRVAAYVARGDSRVARVNLGDLETIQTAITNWRTTLGRGAEGQAAAETLRQRLWLPLEAGLQGIEVVLVSPDGQLAQLPWGALPGARPGTYLIEERAFAVLPIPQFLPELAARKQALGAPRSLLIVADVDYDGVSTIPADPLVASTAIRRTGRDGELRRFPRLRAAQDEADAILQRFRKSRPKVEPLSLKGAAATEDAVRRAAEQEEWLHLITHGYFAPESIKSALQVTQQDRARFSRLDRTDPTLRGPHPGVLSGLAFAGANRPPEAGKDDGILTSLDVSGLDLRNVDTVVLSACETGLGEVAGGEGLLGLQRAFQLAGAKTCVASLWSVDDAGTRVFMQRFYDNLWDKKLPRLGALREAQLWVLRHPQEFLAQFHESERRAMKARGGLELLVSEREDIDDATPPFYWAAFVLSGDWR
jgi:CHAT domain-containing protein/tetratricopeptide (TPR) repeat protein